MRAPSGAETRMLEAQRAGMDGQWRKVPPALLCGFALLVAAPAPHASAWSEQEYRFYDDILAAGFRPPAGAEKVILFGRSICDDLANGITPNDIVEAQSQRGYPKSSMAAIINAARRNLCPDL